MGRAVPRYRLRALFAATAALGATGRFARHHGLLRLRVFGLVARWVEPPGSALDALEPGLDLLVVAGLRLDLEALLGCKVAVMEEASLSPHLRERVLREAQLL